MCNNEELLHIGPKSGGFQIIDGVNVEAAKVGKLLLGKVEFDTAVFEEGADHCAGFGKDLVVHTIDFYELKMRSKLMLRRTNKFR